ncbi:MAG: TetR family transcriptional regulator [Rhizobiales bacterium]|nr:TetR family transcriptional regulator [Hyphomicrobiales bacterium]
MEAPANVVNLRRRQRGERDPVRTREAILETATQEFAAKGLNGARVDTIAKRSRANKRMIYHYFGDKAGLYLAVLEKTYAAIRMAEIGLQLSDRDPVDGMKQLVQFTWNYFIQHPEFLSLLGTENLHRARYLKQSRRIRELHSPLIDMISKLIERGVRIGVFRPDVDAVQLYITIAALGFFYLSNRHTLSTIFGRELDTPERLATRGRHIEEVVLGYLRP